MNGTRGTRRRRRLIRAEFVFGCPVMLALALSVLAGGHFLLGGYLLGVAVNYFPLAAYAVVLFRPGALEAEVAGVQDLHRELRRAGAVQVLLLIPFLVALTAALQLITKRKT